MTWMRRRTFITLCCLALLTGARAAPVAGTKPITQRALLDALKIGGLNTSELVRTIKARGVGFAVTPEVEAQLRRAGAAPEVIAAARENYRPRFGEPPKRLP